MKKSTSLRMLLRSPVKTAVTLLLIAAASFLFLYNLLDYAMTKREYDRNYGEYHGYVSLLHQEDRLLGEIYDYWLQKRFFVSDPASNPAYTGDYPVEQYHLRSFTGEELEELSSLPYVSRVERHYMTQGVADYPRQYYYSSMGCYAKVNYASRVVFEGTYGGTDPDLHKLELPLIIGSGVETTLKLTDVKLISGDEEELKANRLYINKKGLYVKAYAVIPDKADNRLREGSMLPDVGLFARNWLSTDTILGLEKGQRYLFVASVDTYASGAGGIGEEESAPRLPYTYLGDESLYGVCDYIYPLEGEPENYLETERFAGVRQMIEIMEADRYTLDVHYLEDMNGVKRYQDGAYQLNRGRMLTRKDFLEHNPVCVIPESMAQRLGLELGDSLRLNLGDKLLEQYAPMGAVAYSVPRYAENWTEQTFTIVGTFTEGGLRRLPSEEAFWAFGDNAVLVPLSFLPETVDTVNHAYKPTEFTIVIDDADSIIPFRDEVLPRLLDMGYTVNFSDGGWPAVREQLTQAGSLGMVKLAAFTVSAVLVLWLTVYLYILRKKKEFAVMRALGCPSRQARQTLLFPLVALALPAVLLGSIGAAIYTRYAAETNVAEFAAMGLTMDTSLPLPILLAGFGGSLLLLLLLAWAALLRVAHKPPLELLQGGTNRRTGKRKALPPELTESVELAPLPVLEPPVYHRHTTVPHTLRYVGKHLRRTPAKTLLSLGLSLVLCFSIGFFTLLRSTYRDLYQNIEVHPRFLNGFSDNRARDVEKSGYVRDPFYSYRRIGCESNFVEDTLILTNNLNRVTDAEITWREDKGPEMFSQSQAFCVVSRELADELGYTLGSRAEICSSGYIWTLQQGHPELNNDELIDYYHQWTHHFTVAGIAEEEGKTFYAPVATRPHFGSMFSDYIPLDLAEFTLNDYHKATEFRSWVFRMMVGRPGSFSMETAEADRIYQTYRLLETLYPIAFALALILGGVLPAGVILQSAREASLLRVLGTTKRRTRAMLSLEQLFLCFIGLCLAVAALVLAKGSALLAVAGLVAVYAAAHLLACAVSTEAAAVSVTKKNVLELLQVKE